MLKAGRLSLFLERIRAETVGELLEQAEVLAFESYSLAATVIAGGASRRFCITFGFEGESNGTVMARSRKYEGELAEARKVGTEIVSAIDGKQITAWGGLRNKAAHEPTKFKVSKVPLRGTILGIRDFITRHPVAFELSDFSLGCRGRLA